METETNNHEQKAADKQAPKGVEDAAKEAWFYYEHREGNLHQNCFIDGFKAGWQANQLPGVEECVKKAKEILADNRIKLPPTHLAEITNQIKKLINFSQGKTI